MLQNSKLVFTFVLKCSSPGLPKPLLTRGKRNGRWISFNWRGGMWNSCAKRAIPILWWPARILSGCSSKRSRRRRRAVSSLPCLSAIPTQSFSIVLSDEFESPPDGISCSIGVASSKKHIFAEVYATADRALYHAKGQGKNCSFEFVQTQG